MYNDYLVHYGVKGMKWGVRHDKSSSGSGKSGRSSYKVKRSGNKKKLSKALTKEEKRKRALIIGASVVGAVLIGYGAYKLNSTMVAKHNLQKASTLRGMAEVKYKDISRLHTKMAIETVTEDLQNNLPQGTTMRNNPEYVKLNRDWSHEAERLRNYNIVADVIEKSKRRVKSYDTTGLDSYIDIPIMERKRLDPEDYIDYYVKPLRKRSR